MKAIVQIKMSVEDRGEYWTQDMMGVKDDRLKKEIQFRQICVWSCV